MRTSLTVLSAGTSQVGGVVGATALGAIPSTNQSVGHHQGDVVLVGPTASFDGHSNVSKGQGIITNANLRAGETAGSDLRRQHTGFQATQVRAGQLHQVVVLNAAGGSQDDARSLVVGLDVVGQVGFTNGPEKKKQKLKHSNKIR